MKYFVILICLFFFNSFGSNEIKKSHGIIVFQNWNFYFIETKENDFEKLVKNTDTLHYLMIGPPGDDGSNLEGFKKYLYAQYKFKHIKYTAKFKDYYDNMIIDDGMLNYKSGNIFYYPISRYKLKKRKESLTINGKTIILQCDEYTKVEEFKGDR